MRKYYTLAMLIIFFASCRHEESTYTTTIMNNNSSHSIKIIPYYQGTASIVDSKDISPNSALKILSSNTRGKSAGYSYPIYLIAVDSIYVVYDNIATSVYYREGSTGANPKAIKYDSSRSLYNEKNYVRKIVTESKRSISNEYTFTFTENDYLDAH